MAGAQGPGLAAALRVLGRAGELAGVAEAVARAEGAALAAAVAESVPGAPSDWVTQSREAGLDVTGVQDFFDAAVRGRRWRGAPTTTLDALVAAGSTHAAGYARALAEVASAACVLGEPSIRVVGNASVAAAAQLRAVEPGRGAAGGLPDPSSGLPDPSSGLLGLPGGPSDRPRGLPGLPGGLLGTADWRPGGGRPTPSSWTGLEGGETAAREEAALAPEGEAADREQPPAPTLDELLAELDGLIGLADVKREVHRQAQVLRVERLRAEAGLRSPALTRHLVFVGNPGTGKTTVARLVAGIYRALGLLSKGQLVEVDRSELVAGYLGQTATKTGEVVASAKGGVLFIDEAYSLAGDSYGDEAIDTLVKEMEDHRHDLVVIVAGYPDPMAAFIAANPGLSSRFRTVIEFVDYTDDELAQIFERLAAEADYSPVPACLARFRELVEAAPRDQGFGNGRFARNVLEAAIGRLAWRLRDVGEPTVDQLRELLPEDLVDGGDDGEHHEPDRCEPDTGESEILDPADQDPGDEGPESQDPKDQGPENQEPGNPGDERPPR